MTSRDERWREDLNLFIEETGRNLFEIEQAKPEQERDSTLSLFIAGFVRVSSEAGFSRQEIDTALHNGTAYDLSDDPTWREHRRHSAALDSVRKSTAGKMLQVVEIVGMYGGGLGLLVAIGAIAFQRHSLAYEAGAIGLLTFGFGWALTAIVGKVRDTLWMRLLKNSPSSFSDKQ